jgi:hypothetical protein
MVRVPERSNSGRVRDLDRAVKTAVTVPSTPVLVMKCCMLGVSRKGTASVDVMIGLPDEVAGRISVMYIPPVFRESWKRDGARPCRQHMYVRNMFAADWIENCLRISHKLSGSFIVLTMYCGSADTTIIEWSQLTFVRMFSGMYFVCISCMTSIFNCKYRVSVCRVS